MAAYLVFFPTHAGLIAANSRFLVEIGRRLTIFVLTSISTLSIDKCTKFSPSIKFSTPNMFGATITTTVPPPPPPLSSSHAFTACIILNPGTSTHHTPPSSPSSTARLGTNPSLGTFPLSTTTGCPPLTISSGLITICVSGKTADASLFVHTPTSGPRFSPSAPIVKYVKNGRRILCRKAKTSPDSGSTFGWAVIDSNGFPYFSSLPIVTTSPSSVTLTRYGRSDSPSANNPPPNRETLVFAFPVPRRRSYCPETRRPAATAYLANVAARLVYAEKRADRTLDFVLVRADEAAGEGGTAAGDPDAVEHAVAVKEVVRAVGRELRVRAVADVGPVEGPGEGALRHVARGRGKLGNRGKVSGEDQVRVDVRGESGRVDVPANEVVERGEEIGE
ncbi:ABC-2 and Plant PDR ABC-type transporter family protein [Striga asiatica]|uniref:ABC-2 and Plant PDR ABC-type transporter family protein n=1 Tax=Striga asiatica TaxID=4170 RepID=A0A5A7P1T3_STRAF|nr:ABC-2 and Plant PDR ABC-type transporter family protein [Striga asiatica]